MDPENLDWGSITPEGLDKLRNEALHVINHDLMNERNVRRTIKFIICRLKWYEKHLPKNFTQRVVIDTRGQDVSYELLKSMKNSVLSALRTSASVKIEFFQ